MARKNLQNNLTKMLDYGNGCQNCVFCLEDTQPYALTDELKKCK